MTVFGTYVSSGEFRRSYLSVLVGLFVLFGGAWFEALLGQETKQETREQRRRASPRGYSATEVGGSWSPIESALGVEDEEARHSGGHWIEIYYGRPIKRERVIFDRPDFMVPLNDGAPVWRAGADESTVLRSEVALRIGETRIEPGEYTVFVELRPDRWTLIISNWKAQRRYQQNNREALYGSYHYRPHKDVVREVMQLETLPFSFDQLSWQFLDVTSTNGRLALFWDDRMASVPFAIEAGDE